MAKQIVLSRLIKKIFREVMRAIFSRGRRRKREKELNHQHTQPQYQNSG